MKFELELLPDILTHTGQVKAVSTNAHGSTTVTTTTTVTCFAFSGKFGRDIGILQTDMFDWIVIMNKVIHGTIAIDNQVVSVVDDLGGTVISSGVVKALEEYRHWEGGLQFVVAGVNRM